MTTNLNAACKRPERDPGPASHPPDEPDREPRNTPEGRGKVVRHATTPDRPPSRSAQTAQIGNRPQSTPQGQVEHDCRIDPSHRLGGARGAPPARAIPATVGPWADGEAGRDPNARAAGPGGQKHVADADELASNAGFGLGGVGPRALRALPGGPGAVVAAPAFLATVYAANVLELLQQSGERSTRTRGSNGSPSNSMRGDA